MSVKTTKGAGGGLGGSEKNRGSLYFSRPPPPRTMIPDARSLGTFENQESRDGKTRYI